MNRLLMALLLAGCAGARFDAQGQWLCVMDVSNEGPHPKEPPAASGH